MFNLSGQRALVTGATGGIGAAIAKALHAQGAEVILTGTRTEVLEGLKAELGERAFVCASNLSDAENVESLVPTIEEKFGPLDILINNAGVTRDNLIIRMKDEDWQKVLDIDLTACFRLCRAAVKSMMKRRHGRIINITSIVGVMGNAGQTNYCAAKAGLIGMSKALAREIASRGITVNCVAPGFIETSMTDVLPETVKEKLLSEIPQGRMGTPEDIATAVVYLASRESAYLTGQTLHINGGMAMV